MKLKQWNSFWSRIVIYNIETKGRADKEISHVLNFKKENNKNFLFFFEKLDKNELTKQKH